MVLLLFVTQHPCSSRILFSTQRWRGIVRYLKEMLKRRTRVLAGQWFYSVGETSGSFGNSHLEYS